MKVSIVIPVYNEEDYLTACLEAVDKQTRKPDEVIVVDNNCTDDTLKIARRYGFVRVIKEPRQGTVFARDTGFKAAKGDILARIDADTRIPPDWTEKLLSAFDGPDTAAVTGPPRFYDASPSWFFDSSQILFYQRFQRLLAGTYVLWGANMAIRRKVWQDVAPLCAERLDIDEDIDLSFWLHRKGLKVRYLSDLSVGASLQRGRTGLVYTARYLSTWPRDYLLHRMYMRAIIIYTLVWLMVLAALPRAVFRKLFPASGL